MNMWVRALAGLAGGMVAVAQLSAPATGLTTSSMVSAGPGGVSASAVVRGRDAVAVVVVPEATGRLLITVTSDAKRVLLEWRTAANTKAATVMRMRNGKAAGYLPKGSTDVTAKALPAAKKSEGTPAAPAATPSATPSTEPGCAQTISLGKSVQGRAIDACQLRGSDDRATHTVLVVGSVHGIEPAGLGVVSRLQEMDITGRKANVWVIKTANPDGTLVLSRGNAHKVDLNRNFPDSRWKVQGVGTVVYGGRKAGSEPETQALMSAMEQIKPTEVVVFHQQLNLIDCTPYRPQTLSRTLHELTGYRLLSPPKCLANWVGQFTTWANETYATTSAVTFELEARPPASRLDRVAEAMVQLGAELPPVGG
jgi:hypothetical protein